MCQPVHIVLDMPEFNLQAFSRIARSDCPEDDGVDHGDREELQEHHAKDKGGEGGHVSLDNPGPACPPKMPSISLDSSARVEDSGTVKESLT